MAKHDQAEALAKIRVETQKLNKAHRDKAKINAATGYEKLNLALRKTRKEAQDVAAEMFEMARAGDTASKEYQELAKKSAALTKQTQVLDKGIKDIDQSLGLHHRNVGNYKSGLADVSPVLGNVDRQLSLLGTSLDGITQSKNPFGTIITGVKNLGKAMLTFLLSPVGLTIAALGGLFMLIKKNKDTVVEFDSNLRNVGKTTGLVGDELRALGDETVKLSRKLGTVSTNKLLEYESVAGQLGVKGSKNILAFASALAQLETASDIQGEEGASNIARFLILVDGGVQNVQEFGDEIVNLGNSFAATENEILSNATAISQNTGQYAVARETILAYATATKAAGIEAELTGSTMGRTLALIEKAIRTGDGINDIAKLTGINIENLKSAFAEDSGAVFNSFVKGLNSVQESGGSLNGTLEQLGITSVRDQRVIGSLATAGFDTLDKALIKVTDSSGAMSREFGAANLKLENQWNRLKIAWDNVVLSVEDGQGVFSKLFAFFVNIGATALEDFNQLINQISNEFNLITSEVNGLLKELGLFQDETITLTDVIKGLSFALTFQWRVLKDILKTFRYTIVTIKRLKDVVYALKDQFISTFSQIQEIVNNFDISKPFESLSKLKDIDVTSTFTAEFNKSEFERAKQRFKNALNSIGDVFEETTGNNKTNNRPVRLDEPKVATNNSKDSVKNSSRDIIKAAEMELELFIKVEEEKRRTKEETLKFIDTVTKERLNILDKELKNGLISQTEHELKRINILTDAEKQRIEINKTYAQEEIKNFELRNESLIDSVDKLTDTLIEKEKERLDKLRELKVKALEEEYGLNAGQVEERFNNGEELYGKELEFYEKLIKANEEYSKQVIDNEKAFSEEKRKEYERRLALSEGFFERERELTQEAYEEQTINYEEYLRALNDIDKRALEAKKAIEEMKLSIAIQGLEVLAQILGRETAMGKAAAVASTTISTYLAAQEAYENVLSSPLARLMPDGGVSLAAVSAGIAVAQGLMRVRSILSTETPAFETGTDHAPYTGKAIVDEAGPEIHLSKDGKVKSLGKKGGARMARITKGDKIIPFEQSEAIKKALGTPTVQYPMIQSAPIIENEKIDYSKIGSEFTKALSKHPNKQFLIDPDGNMIEIETTSNSTRKKIYTDFKPRPSKLR